MPPHHPTATERKIQEIYDAIEKNQEKTAVRLCNALLEKQQLKEAHLIRTLKAIALERMGKPDEALVECEKVRSEVPVDDDVLRKLYFVHRELVDLHTSCYENAHKKLPDNESISCGLFFAYCRQFRFSDQKNHALKLMKSYPSKNQYYFFVAVSLVQMIPTSELKPKNMNLVMAEKMLEKVELSFKYTLLPELEFALYVYELNEKYSVALEHLEKYSNLFKMEEDYLSRKAFYQIKLNNIPAAREIYYQLLTEKKQENWDFLVKFMNCFKDEENKIISPEGFSESFRLINELKKIYSDAPPQRLIHLGEIEVNFQQFLITQSPEVKEEIIKLMGNYVKLFGSKPTCFRDLKLYFDRLPTDVISAVFVLFKENIDSISEYSVSKITRMIIHEQLRMHAGEHKAIISSGNYEKIKEEVLRLYDLYKLSENYKTGESVTESERYYADDLLLLSSHLLYSFFQFLKSNPSPDLPKDYLFSLLFQGILLLHYSLRNSNLNFQLKIVLLRLYCLVSAIEPAYSLFKSLDIKHIQFDTFSHVLYHDAALLPSPSSVSFLNSVNRFYVESLKELPELITYPYRYQSYTRAREFRNFHDKLATTLQRATHSVEFAMQQLFIQNAFSSPASALTVLTPYIPKVLHSEEQLKELYETADNSFVDGWHNLLDLSSDYTGNSASNLFSFQQKVDFVGFRGASFHLLVAILKGSDAESISKLFSSFTDSYAKLKFDGSTSPIWTLYFNLSKYSTSFLSFLFTLKEKTDVTEADVPNKESRDLLTSLSAGITERVKELVNNQSSYFAVDALPLCSLYVSVLSWSYLLFTTINPLIPKRLPKKANQTTKNLHKAVRNEFVEVFNKLMDESIPAARELLESALIKCDSVQFVDELPIHEEFTSFLSTAQTDILSSWKNTLKELINHLKSLNTLNELINHLKNLRIK